MGSLSSGIAPPQSKAQCTHLTMTRLYGFEFICDCCRRPGPFGWVYRCTQDREDIIEHAVANGYPAVFDDLGAVMVSQMGVRERSPVARADQLSFFDELKPSQMSKYRPDQIATILWQRCVVRLAIARDKLRGDADIASNMIPADDCELPISEKDDHWPWVTSLEDECRYMVCPMCRPRAADRAFLSLDAVAKGEIPPTSAVGYGFHAMGERPVANADILKTIGCRPVPLRPTRTYQESPSTSAISVMELLDIQIAHGQSLLGQRYEERDEERDNGTLPLPQSTKDIVGRLRHSPRCENLAAFSESSDAANQSSNVLARWAPPLPMSQGNTPSTNDIYRTSQIGHSGSDLHIPYLDELASFDGAAFEAACQTPLAPPDPAEECHLHGSTTPMMEFEEEGKTFTPALLRVDHGVAMLEESVELGVPDVVTQV